MRASHPEQCADSYAIVNGLDVRDSSVHNYPRRWNAAPSQDLLVIRRNHQTGQVSLDPLRWGLIPYWCEDPKDGRKPINAKCETVATLPTFRDAYRRRRCIVPVDGFFEWKAIKGQKATAHISQMFGVHPTHVGGWKKQAVAGLPDVFGNGREQIRQQADAEKDELYK